MKNTWLNLKINTSLTLIKSKVKSEEMNWKRKRRKMLKQDTMENLNKFMVRIQTRKKFKL